MTEVYDDTPPSPPSPLPSLGEGCRRRGEGRGYEQKEG